MPKARMETTESENNILDDATLRKLKQHNRSIYQKKKQDAVALRQKLQQWKEEKKKKAQEEREKKEEEKKPFVTTVKTVPKKRPAVPQTKPPVAPKSVSGPAKTMPKVPAKGERRKALASTIQTEVKKTLAITTKCQPKQTKALSKVPTNGAQKVVSTASKGDKAPKPVKTIASKVKQSSRPQAPVKILKTGQKENRQPVKLVSCHPSTGRKTDHGSRPLSTKSASSHSSETPLSGNRKGFGKRHIINDMTRGEEEGRPLSLAEEMQAASGASQSAVPESTASLSEPQPSVDGNVTVDYSGHFDEKANSDFGNETAATCHTNTKTKGTARDSLTSRFRKSKHQPNSVKRNPSSSVPKANQRLSHVSAVKKSSRKSIHAGKPTISTPPRSILKRKTCTFSFQTSEVGASPLLPGPRPFHATVTVTSTTKDKTGSQKRDGVVKQCQESQDRTATSSGHVAFAVDAGKDGDEGTSFRKTPGRDKSQDYMRMKLDEWLEAKGRTPASLRHVGCFHGSGEGSRWLTPRSHIKASMSVEQLSRQESALSKEDTTSIRKRLDLTDTRLPSISRRSAPARSTMMTGADRLSHNSSRKRQPVSQTSEEAMETEDQGPVDVSYDSMQCGSSEDTIELEETLSPRTSLSRRQDGVSPSMAAEQAGLSVQTESSEQLDGDYQKCLAALQSGGIDAESALQWLDMVSEANSEVLKDAIWYKCRVAALRLMADEDTVLSVFELAIINNAQPAEEMAKLLTDTMRELLSGQKTRRRRRSHKTSTAKCTSGSSRMSQSRVQMVSLPKVQTENIFKSTTVKYSVTEVTPFKKRRRTTDTEERVVPVITPVRRSTRLDTATCASEGRPPLGTPHVAEYSALEDVPSAEKQRMLFQPNEAVEPLMLDESPELDRHVPTEVEQLASPDVNRDVVDMIE